MDATPALFFFFILVAGLLLGLACKAMTATDEEKAEAALLDHPAGQPAPGPSEAPALAPADLHTKDCKSCGGHLQTGTLCSFCGRAL
jgi:hypothetical protein